MNGYKRIGVVGSREYPSEQQIKEFIYLLPHDVEIVSGGQSKGVDGWAKKYALKRNMKYTEFAPAHYYEQDDPRYKPYNPINFFERNRRISVYSDVVFAFMHRHSTGTQSTVDFCNQLGTPVKVVDPQSNISSIVVEEFQIARNMVKDASLTEAESRRIDGIIVQITRSNKALLSETKPEMYKLGSNFMYEPELSPTFDLLESWNDIKKKFKDGTPEYDKAWDEFIIKFKEQIDNNPIAQMRLRHIKSLSEKNPITLVCYETDNKNCHRRYIKKWMANLDKRIEKNIEKEKINIPRKIGEKTSTKTSVGMPTIKVKDITTEKQEVPNIELIILSKDSKIRDFTKKGVKRKICNAVGWDDTGEIKLVLTDNEINSVQKRYTIRITNGYVTTYEGQFQLGTGYKGNLEVLAKEPKKELEKAFREAEKAFREAEKASRKASLKPLKVKDIFRPKQRIPSIELRIVEKGAPYEFVDKYGGTGKVCTVIGQDKTGKIGVSLFGGDIKRVDRGDIIRIEDGYTSKYNDKICVIVGDYGMLEILGEKEGKKELEEVTLTEPVTKKEETIQEKITKKIEKIRKQINFEKNPSEERKRIDAKDTKAILNKYNIESIESLKKLSDKDLKTMFSLYCVETYKQIEKLSDEELKKLCEKKREEIISETPEERRKTEILELENELERLNKIKEKLTEKEKEITEKEEEKITEKEEEIKESKDEKEVVEETKEKAEDKERVQPEGR